MPTRKSSSRPAAAAPGRRSRSGDIKAEFQARGVVNPGMARPTRAAAPLPPMPWTVRLYVGLSWLLGWWLALDGLHQRLFGDYVRLGGRLGPWADVATALGLDPQRFGMAFVALGLAGLGASFGVVLRRRWGYTAALVTSALGLLYLGFGLPVALACLVLLLLPVTRAYVLGPGSG
jgi:hypothetical protein